MKKLLSIFLLLLAGAALATDYSQDKHCLGAWFMNGAGESWELDRSPSADDTLFPRGTLSNVGPHRVTTVPTDFSGTSRRFINAVNYLEAAASSQLDINGANAQISVVFRIRNMVCPDSAVTQVVVSKFLATGNHRQYRFGITGSGSGKFIIRTLLSNDGTNYTTANSATTYDDSTWIAVAVTSDDDSIRTYVNGALDGTPVKHQTGIASKSGRFSIASQYSGSRIFQGNIDEVAVFDRALSAAEVNNIYTYGLTGDSGKCDTPYYTQFVDCDGNYPANDQLYDFVRDSLTALAAIYTDWIYAEPDKTPNGRPLITLVINPVDYVRTIHLNAGIHGGATVSARGTGMYEGKTAYMAVEVARWLGANPYPRVRVVINPLVNPDGVALSQCKNHNIVADPNYDANIARSFPPWTGIDTVASSDSEYPGPEPFSESESRVLRDQLLDYPPDLYLELHGSSNMLIPAYKSATMKTPDSTHLRNHGLEPFLNVSNSVLDTRGGWSILWAYDTAGAVNATVMEMNGASNAAYMAEETNRLCCYLDYWLNKYSYVPWIDSVTVSCSKTAILYWSENPGTDSIRIIRNGSRITAVTDSIFTYTDTVANYGAYTYQLLSFYDGGQASDTSNYYDAVIISCTTTADNPNTWGGQWQQTITGWGSTW